MPPLSNVHSASVTARPPSEQSCADSMQPSRISLTISFCSAASRSRSSAGGAPGDQVVHRRQVLAAAELSSIIAQQHDRRADRLEDSRRRLRRVVEQADHAEHRRREDRAALGFVVEADVAAGDRHVERAAGVADAADGFADLPHDLGPLGIAEVQVVGRADRLAAGARDVARRFGHGEHRAADTGSR